VTGFLDVIFQEVVYPVRTGDADFAKRSDSLRTDWTPTRMPAWRRKVESRWVRAAVDSSAPEIGLREVGLMNSRRSNQFTWFQGLALSGRA